MIYLHFLTFSFYNCFICFKQCFAKENSFLIDLTKIQDSFKNLQ